MVTFSGKVVDRATTKPIYLVIAEDQTTETGTTPAEETPKATRSGSRTTAAKKNATTLFKQRTILITQSMRELRFGRATTCAQISNSSTSRIRKTAISTMTRFLCRKTKISIGWQTRLSPTTKSWKGSKSAKTGW